MSFGEFLRTRLFEPLGMNDTAFWVPPEKTRAVHLLLSARGQGGGLKLQDDAGESTYAEPPRLESGGGGLVSTAHDYMRFCRMMLNGGTLDGVQILSPKTVALFSLNYLPDGRELADMALPGMFSESRLCRASAFRSAAASTSTSPRPACRARSANISGAAPPRPRSGSTRRKS